MEIAKIGLRLRRSLVMVVMVYHRDLGNATTPRSRNAGLAFLWAPCVYNAGPRRFDPMIVTIDGPAGSGKSTAARRLADALGTAYLDTGAMYRAIALRALRAGVPLHDHARLTTLADQADLRVECHRDGVRVVLDGMDVTEAIRTMEVNATTSIIAKIPGVREALVRRQREIGRRLGSLVTEGRDQGSVVFPDADVKFLVEADVDTRAARRYEEMKQDGQDVTIRDVRANLIERDDRDAVRWAPLLQGGKAIRIDTSDMTIDEVVSVMVRHIRRLGIQDKRPT
jgi:cytidylate kinase